MLTLSKIAELSVTKIISSEEIDSLLLTLEALIEVARGAKLYIENYDKPYDLEHALSNPLVQSLLEGEES